MPVTRRPRLIGPSGRLMLAASSLTTLGAIPPFLLGSQAVLMKRDLDFGAAGLGIAVSTFFAVAATCTILASTLLDRLAGRPGRALSGGVVAAGGLGLALLVNDWPSLVVAMAVLGVGNALCQGTSNKTVATVLPPHRRGLGFGMKQSAVPAAIMLGGLAVPTTTEHLGWRSTFVITGVVGLLVLLTALLRTGGTVLGSGTTDRAEPDRAPDRAPWGPLLLCGAAITFASMAANFIGAYLASWAHHVGLTIGQAGLLMAAGSSMSILVRIASGFQADRRYGGNLSVVATMIAIGAACLAAIGTFPAPWAAVVFGVLAFAGGWSWPGLMLYAVARVGREAPTQASSVVQAGAFTGGALGPAVLGLVVSEVSFQSAWFVASALFVVAFTLTLVARAGFRRDLVRRPPRQRFGYGGGQLSPKYVAGGEN
ncbi:MFS transporter [Ornithinimicrobium panacihumi]|uniref:MFS transporter n=1 Tax=Ornithinimicrobium panacihumi TaxID=2008449 RepID=UPI003F8A520F